MKQDDYILLIYKKLKGELSSSEQITLSKWVGESKENSNLVDVISQNWQQSSQFEPNLSIDKSADFARLQQRIEQHKKQQNQPPKVVQMKPRRRWMAIAASFLILITAGLWFVSQNSSATQTLALETGEGEQKSISLKDGSEIFLNENSQLFLVGDFNKTDRKIAFEGEGYFKIAKNPNRSFLIEMKETTVEVLGTEFNLRSYQDELKTEVLVAEGKVKFENSADNSIVLTANQQGIFYRKSQTIQKIDNPKSNAYAWKSGILTYKNTPIEKVLIDLERVFNVTASLKNEKMKTCLVSGRFPNAKPKAVLEYLATYFKMELVELGNKKYQLNNGVCE